MIKTLKELYELIIKEAEIDTEFEFYLDKKNYVITFMPDCCDYYTDHDYFDAYVNPIKHKISKGIAVILEKYFNENVYGEEWTVRNLLNIPELKDIKSNIISTVEELQKVVDLKFPLFYLDDEDNLIVFINPDENEILYCHTMRTFVISREIERFVRGNLLNNKGNFSTSDLHSIIRKEIIDDIIDY